MAETKRQMLHIAVFPWAAFGHMIPMLELGKHLAMEGHRVSFMGTPRNIDRLPQVPQNLRSLITLVKIPLHHVDNLPENAEATSDVSLADCHFLVDAVNGLRDPVSQFLRTARPDWIIHDIFPHWVPSLADELGISNIHFVISNATSICSFYPLLTRKSTVPSGRSNDQSLDLSSDPSEPLSEGSNHEKVLNKEEFMISSSVPTSQAFLIRSCTEIEAETFTKFKNMCQKPVIPLGVLAPKVDEAGNADTEDQKWVEIYKWLNKKEEGTVVFIAFGSTVSLNQQELSELALGLELSGLPFFWVLKKPKSEEASAELPEGFEERTKMQGIVTASSVPQLKILQHKSIGGFLSHCSWSSVVESLALGVPLIMLPFRQDHRTSFSLCRDNNVGVGIPRNEEGSFSKESVAEMLRLLIVDEKGEIYRKSAKEIGKMLVDEELQKKYIDSFLDFLENQRHAAKSG